MPYFFNCEISVLIKIILTENQVFEGTSRTILKDEVDMIFIGLGLIYFYKQRLFNEE